MYRSLSLAVNDVKISSGVEHEQRHVTLVTSESEVEGRGSPLVLTVEDGLTVSTVQQTSDTLDVATRGCHVQRSLVLLVPGVDTCPGLTQYLHNTREAVPGSNVKTSLQVLKSENLSSKQFSGLKR